MRFSNYAIQSKQIQVTFAFKKQNVRQTTYRNNSLNGWRTNPERYSESNTLGTRGFSRKRRTETLRHRKLREKNLWHPGYESNKQHSNSFQKTTRVLFSFNNCTIQSQQIQDVFASKRRMVGKLLKYFPK